MSKYKVFVIMPFQEAFFEVYEMLRREFNDEFEFSNAAIEGNQQNILKDIIKPIYDTDIVIAELTGLNPNVLYELGIAHSFDKKTIVITQDELSLLPFDLKQYRAKSYTTHFVKFAELVEYLKTNLKGAADGSIAYSNPVKDFLSENRISIVDCYNQDIAPILEINADGGFLDFITEIEDDTITLTNNIDKMTLDMKAMTAGVAQSTNEVERVNKSGGSGNTAFVRKEAKKVAEFIHTFSTKLKYYNPQTITLWNRIELNVLGLLENKFSTHNDNKLSLISYLKSLKKMQEEMLSTNTSIKDLGVSLRAISGMERSLNQAIRFLDEDLKTYLGIMEQISTSIDRIIEKSKFVVGIIDFNAEN